MARSESDSFTSLSHASLVNRGQIRDDMWTSKFDYTSRRRYSVFSRSEIDDNHCGYQFYSTFLWLTSVPRVHVWLRIFKRLANHRILCMGLEWPRMKKLSWYGDFRVLKLIAFITP